MDFSAGRPALICSQPRSRSLARSRARTPTRGPARVNVCGSFRVPATGRSRERILRAKDFQRISVPPKNCWRAHSNSPAPACPSPRFLPRFLPLLLRGSLDVLRTAARCSLCAPFVASLSLSLLAAPFRSLARVLSASPPPCEAALNGRDRGIAYEAGSRLPFAALLYLASTLVPAPSRRTSPGSPP